MSIYIDYHHCQTNWDKYRREFPIINKWNCLKKILGIFWTSEVGNQCCTNFQLLLKFGFWCIWIVNYSVICAREGEGGQVCPLRITPSDTHTSSAPTSRRPYALKTRPRPQTIPGTPMSSRRHATHRRHALRFGPATLTPHHARWCASGIKAHIYVVLPSFVLFKG